MTEQVKKVGLFVTCLVDTLRPNVGFAAVKLLQEAGCLVAVPENQTCCGQPTFNSGDNLNSRQIAKNVIETFRDFDYVVAPSGSCAAMIKEHYTELFEDEPEWAAKAQDLSARCYELVSFLVDICHMKDVSAKIEATATYHDSCSGLRELEIKSQPRQLLSKVEGLKLKEMKSPETCCGFGGAFCVKYPDISGKIVDEKAEDISKTNADLLLAGDLGCLFNMSGRLQRKENDIRVFHVAEVLANMADGPGIGAPSKPINLDKIAMGEES